MCNTGTIYCISPMIGSCFSRINSYYIYTFIFQLGWLGLILVSTLVSNLYWHQTCIQQLADQDRHETIGGDSENKELWFDAPWSVR